MSFEQMKADGAAELAAEPYLAPERMAFVQSRLPLREDYIKALDAGEFYDVSHLEKFAALPEQRKEDEDDKAFFKRLWADPSIFRVENGERVVDTEMVKAINHRTEEGMKRYGVELTDKDPVTGLWLNPLVKFDPEMKLVEGRGGLGKFGLNEAVDVRVRTVNPEDGREYILNFRRPQDGGALAIPGGMIDHGETPLEAVKREFAEEIGTHLPEDAEIIEVGAYIVADPRNTAHSFMGTTLFDVQVSWEVAQKIREEMRRPAAEKVRATSKEALDPDLRPTSGEGSIFAPGTSFFASHEDLMSTGIRESVS